MILDTLDNIDKYASLHPDFAKVFKLLRESDFAGMPAGHYEYPGEDFYINVDESQLRSAEVAYPEVHDKYIDIQMPIATPEVVGYRPRCTCKDLRSANPEKDIAFYNDKSESFIQLNPGSFIILFPQDAHAPIIGQGTTKKVIAKVRLK